MLAVITLCVILPLALLLQRKLPEAGHQIAAQQVKENIQKTRISPLRLQLLLCVAGVACCIAMSMPQVHIVSYCVGLGYGPAVGAEMLSLMLFGGVISRIGSGLIADRIGGIRTLLLGSFAQGVALVMYLPFDGMASLYLVSFIFGLSQGGIVPSYALVVREFLPPKEAGARIGVVIMMTIIGMALGGWMSGWIYQVTDSYQAAFINGIAWNGLNLGYCCMDFDAQPERWPATSKIINRCKIACWRNYATYQAFPRAETGHNASTLPPRTPTYQSCKLQVGSQ